MTAENKIIDLKLKETKKITGMFWHVHHDKLCEWCYDYQERADFIKNEKPKNEIEIRLNLFKKVKGKLPKEFIEAHKKYAEADNKWVEACKCPEIEKLHKKECGCKYWDGKELVFGK